MLNHIPKASTYVSDVIKIQLLGMKSSSFETTLMTMME
uniref:Uncharacterized protein n=1 Tax=Lepeophtheirus salmonis TaxID=72036 RepID=A0A0K2T113_LEPSM